MTENNATDLSDFFPETEEARRKREVERVRRENERKLIDAVIQDGFIAQAEKEAALAKVREAALDRLEKQNCATIRRLGEETTPIALIRAYDDYHDEMAIPFGADGVCIFSRSGIADIYIGAVYDKDRDFLLAFAVVGHAEPRFYNN